MIIPNHSHPADLAPDSDECELFEVNPRYVPHHLASLEMIKGRPHWKTREDWQRGHVKIINEQWGLLMPCKDDIIREIREARGSIPPGEPTDLDTYPVGSYPGVRLADVVGSLNTNGRSAALILASIETLLQAQGQGDADQLELLGKLVILLGV